MAWEVILLSPCPFWIRCCLLNFYQKIPNFFVGENWHKLNWANLKHCVLQNKPLNGARNEYFSWFHSSCQWGLRPEQSILHFFTYFSQRLSDQEWEWLLLRSTNIGPRIMTMHFFTDTQYFGDYVHILYVSTTGLSKGQLNSEWIFNVIVSPKCQPKILRISSLPNKQGS